MGMSENTVTTTGPGSDLLSILPSCCSAASSRDTPIEKPGADRPETDRAAAVILDLERQIHFEHRAGVVLKTAYHGWIDADLPKVVCRPSQIGDLAKFIQSMLVNRAVWKSATRGINYSDIPRNIGVAGRQRDEHVHYLIDLLRGEICTLRVITTFVFSTRPKEGAHAVRSEPIIFVDRAQHCESLARMPFAPEPDRLQHTIKHLAIVHLHHVAAAWNAQRLHGVGSHHAHLGIGGHCGRADGVGVELHELAKAARARLLVTEHPAFAIAAIGFWQLFEILRDVARERRGQVVTQRERLLVVVL